MMKATTIASSLIPELGLPAEKIRLSADKLNGAYTVSQIEPVK